MVLEEHEPQRSPNVAKVFVNGARIGVHCNAAHLVRTVQHLRRTHLISHEVGLVGDIYDLEFKFFIDVGRTSKDFELKLEGSSASSKKPDKATQLKPWEFKAEGAIE
ncbi:MAG: DNA-dependent RNA polymerase II [Trichoglossum hirsutum]|nr:MAG: DNA-dependent RNA polymerase II [Trichoglossum hirsutum]